MLHPISLGFIIKNDGIRIDAPAGSFFLGPT